MPETSDSLCRVVAYHGTRASVDFNEFSCSGVVFDEKTGDPISSGSGADPTAYFGAHFAEDRKVAEKFARGTHEWTRSRYDGEKPNPRVFTVDLNFNKLRDMGSETNLRNFIFQGKVPDDMTLEIAMRRDGIDDCFSAEGEKWFEQYDSDQDFRIQKHEYIFTEHRAAEGEEEMLREAACELAFEAQMKLKADGYDGVKYQNIVEGGVSFAVFDPDSIKVLAIETPEGLPIHADQPLADDLQKKFSAQPTVPEPDICP